MILPTAILWFLGFSYLFDNHTVSAIKIRFYRTTDPNIKPSQFYKFNEHNVKALKWMTFDDMLWSTAGAQQPIMKKIEVDGMFAIARVDLINDNPGRLTRPISVPYGYNSPKVPSADDVSDADSDSDDSDSDHKRSQGATTEWITEYRPVPPIQGIAFWTSTEEPKLSQLPDLYLSPNFSPASYTTDYDKVYSAAFIDTAKNYQWMMLVNGDEGYTNGFTKRKSINVVHGYWPLETEPEAIKEQRLKDLETVQGPEWMTLAEAYRVKAWVNNVEAFNFHPETMEED